MDDVFVSKLLKNYNACGIMVFMKKNKGGFTLIEVALFLAITGLLFLGVTIGVQNSIFQQRYNDSVQSFVEFLRTAYAKVENVQGRSIKSDSGKTNKALYGKLITFGEEKELNKANNVDNKIFIYDIVGDVKCNGNDGLMVAISSLMECDADVIDENGEILGLAESYTPKWSAAIQKKEGAENFKGALLIIRHPQTGTVNTYSILGDTVEVNSDKKSLKTFIEEHSVPGDTDKGFSTNRDVDFCINPNGDQISNIRSNVRIKANAGNSSAIEIMPDNENRCAERG